MIIYLLSVVAFSQQNPSPMVEHARPHPRLKQESPTGHREPLAMGSVFIPDKLRSRKTVPLVIHFHGGTWLPEIAAARDGHFASIAIQLGSGSAAYGKPFASPNVFAKLVREAESKSGVRFQPVVLSAWSAGYGAVREILRVPENYARVDKVLLIDGLHASYVSGKPGPQESELAAGDLDIFLQFARDAVAKRKTLIVTHSEIFPGTFASTTETADWLLKQLGLRRTAQLRNGPMGMQQLSEAASGNFRVIGYAGNSAPDHVDQLHSLPQFLKWLR